VDVVAVQIFERVLPDAPGLAEIRRGCRALLDWTAEGGCPYKLRDCVEEVKIPSLSQNCATGVGRPRSPRWGNPHFRQNRPEMGHPI